MIGMDLYQIRCDICIRSDVTSDIIRKRALFACILILKLGVAAIPITVCNQSSYPDDALERGLYKRRIRVIDTPHPPTYHKDLVESL